MIHAVLLRSLLLRSLTAVMLVTALGCSTRSATQPPSTTTEQPTTDQTTSRPAQSVTTSSSTSVPPTAVVPTVEVPVRDDGLEALDLDPDDLGEVTVFTPEVVQLLPHDRTAVTEGLSLLTDDVLLESTGLYGRSSRRLLEVTTGSLLNVESLRPELYATGVTSLGSGVGLQVTELEELVQLFDTETLALIEERSIDLELTGVCRSAEGGPLRAATSDGLVHALDAGDLSLLETITPRIAQSPLPPLTDLTCVGDTVWGVVGVTAVLVRMNPETGAVTGVTDLASLTPAGLASNDVLSGVAYRPGSDSWFVTGRRWDVLYEIQLRP